MDTNCLTSLKTDISAQIHVEQITTISNMIDLYSSLKVLHCVKLVSSKQNKERKLTVLLHARYVLLTPELLFGDFCYRFYPQLVTFLMSKLCLEFLQNQLRCQVVLKAGRCSYVSVSKIILLRAIGLKRIFWDDMNT